MCPLLSKCPKHLGARYPKSDITAVTQLGAKCMFAHHPNELQFPETLPQQIAQIDSLKEKMLADVNSKKPLKPFMPSGYYHTPADPRTRQLDPDSLPKASTKTQADVEREWEDRHLTRLEKLDQGEKEFFETMHRNKKEYRLDDCFIEKFGLLKKATVFLKHGREKDARDKLIEAGRKIREQRKLEEEKQEAIQ